MTIAPFSIARLPRIEFGEDCFGKVPALAGHYGTRVLLVTGGHSLERSGHGEQLQAGLRERGVSWEHIKITGEPSPETVDQAIADLTHTGLQAVVGIGGGSVLDAAKAIAGLLPHGNSVMDHLEGVGPELPYAGPPLPYIAVPTTAGTGSEATKNAVLSRQGKDGFKKSFRDEQLVPNFAVVDPQLLATCPPSLIAANGMDALTQLMESYVSSRANPMTDALALSGIEAVRDGLLAWYDGRDDAGAGRTRMAYAALLSGITLAQAGLGSVHGLAAPLGACFPIPHGAACGTLLAAATRVNVSVMQARQPDNPALVKYARVGELLSGKQHKDPAAARKTLIEVLTEWTEHMGLERLNRFGVRANDFAHIVAHSRGSSMKTNPIVLTDDEVEQVLRIRA